MDTWHEQLINELRALIRDLGENGGKMSASVYDTAQLLRFHPSICDQDAVKSWLLQNQQADGGWGDPHDPQARDLPTYAALLALDGHRSDRRIAVSVTAACDFLKQHAPQHWGGDLPDDIPVGIELLLPPLLDEATNREILLPHEPYAAVRALGKKRRQMIALMHPEAGTPPVHSWEGWGETPEVSVVDRIGSVGHSPAATAAWVRSSSAHAAHSYLRTNTQQYLQAASMATGYAQGIVPTIWPISRFEQIWALYTLFVAEILDHPELRHTVRAQMDSLYASLRPDGIGVSDDFMADGDDTATAIALLKVMGYHIDHRILHRFQQGDLFLSYPHELQPSVTTTAHAVLALALCQEDVSRPVRFLMERLTPDGRWVVDKWHCSWLYTTAQVITALAYAHQFDAVRPAVEAMLREQHESGGWGMAGYATAAETAYAVLALFSIRSLPCYESYITQAITRARRWLLERFDPIAANQDRYWIGKELYCPYRIDHAYILSAIMATSEYDIALEYPHQIDIAFLRSRFSGKFVSH